MAISEHEMYPHYCSVCVCVYVLYVYVYLVLAQKKGKEHEHASVMDNPPHVNVALSETLSI